MPIAPEPVDLEAAVAGLAEAGRAWLTEHLQARTNWSSRDMALLRQAAEARDRQAAAQAVIAAEGAFVKVRKRSVPHPALAIERQCSTAILTALRALTPESSKPAGKVPPAAAPANPLEKFLNRRQR